MNLFLGIVAFMTGVLFTWLGLDVESGWPLTVAGCFFLGMGGAMIGYEVWSRPR